MLGVRFYHGSTLMTELGFWSKGFCLALLCGGHRPDLYVHTLGIGTFSLLGYSGSFPTHDLFRTTTYSFCLSVEEPAMGECHFEVTNI